MVVYVILSLWEHGNQRTDTSIYYMIETKPTMSVSKIVNLMKSYTTYHILEKYPKIHRKSRITIGKAVFVDVKSI